MEEIFDFNEFIFYILRKWRFILSVAVVFAMISAGYQIYSQIKILHKPVISATNNGLQQRASQLNTYVRESIKMKIDPFNEYVASITFLVHSDILDNNSTSDIAALYMRLQNDDRLYEKIKNDGDINISPDFFRELITWSVSNVSSSSFEVNIIGHTPELTQAIADSVVSYYKEENQRMGQYIGVHVIEPVSQGSYVTIDQPLETYQKNIKNALNKLTAENLATTGVTTTIKSIIVKAALYAAMGGLVGVGISILLLLFWDSMRMTTKSDKDVSKKYNLRFLGYVSSRDE